MRHLRNGLCRGNACGHQRTRPPMSPSTSSCEELVNFRRPDRTAGGDALFTSAETKFRVRIAPASVVARKKWIVFMTVCDLQLTPSLERYAARTTWPVQAGSRTCSPTGSFRIRFPVHYGAAAVMSAVTAWKLREVASPKRTRPHLHRRAPSGSWQHLQSWIRGPNRAAIRRSERSM